jgi:hypothetical protein
LTPFHRFIVSLHVHYPSCYPFREELDDVPIP